MEAWGEAEAPAADQDDAAAELPPMEEPEIEQDADDPRPAAPDTHVYDLTGRGNAEEIPDFRPGIDSIALSMGGADFYEQDDLFMQTGVEDTAEGVQLDFGNGNTLLLGGVTAEGLDAHGLDDIFEDTDPATGDWVDVIMLEDQVMEYVDEQWRLEWEQQREEEAEALPEPDTEAPAEALPDQEPVIHTYNFTSGGEATIADFDLAKDQVACELEGFVNDAGYPRYEDIGVEDTAEGVQLDFGNGNTLLFLSLIHI